MDLEKIKQVFLSTNWEITNLPDSPAQKPNKSVVEFKSRVNGEFIYLKLDQFKPDQLSEGHIRIVLHPKFAAVHRALIGKNQEATWWDRSSNLRRFPDRPDTKPGERRPYGIIIEPDGLLSLEIFLQDFQVPTE